MTKFLKKVCISMMILVMFGLNIQIPMAQAAMVGTDQIIQQQFHDQSREKIIAFLDRTEVQQQLQGNGVALEDARARVANLSDAEVQMLSGKIDQLPAGGGAVGVIVGTAVFIFLVLLITDILGLTDVFSFVNPVR
ncbi:MAG: PA2779 family protein [Mariprofundaceae bacterium]|nr:PA2779 family protein [Mariprofundaceae bacterium]